MMFNDLFDMDDASSLDQSGGSGLTVISAVAFLRKAVPGVQDWMSWETSNEVAAPLLGVFTGSGIKAGGTVGEWSWERVPTDYPSVHFWDGDTRKSHIGAGWVGLLRITAPDSAQFLIFSYLTPAMKRNREYLVSTGDTALLRRFADALGRHFKRRRSDSIVTIDMFGGGEVTLNVRTEEPIYLPPDLMNDIESQVFSFFENGGLYKQLGIPHKRGFLFTGAPGTGKTLMIRRLVRECYKRYKVDASCLSIKANLDSDHLCMFFRQSSGRSKRILILEDMDSITRETAVTRASLLAELDGLQQRTGMLVIGTTNYPEAVDPALLHRPSRFDRVWHFPLPDASLRTAWLHQTMPGTPVDLERRILSETRGWTFAYLKELRVTAGILSLRAGSTTLRSECIGEALDLLAAQFRNLSKCMTARQEDPSQIAGFRDATDVELRNCG